MKLFNAFWSVDAGVITKRPNVPRVAFSVNWPGFTTKQLFRSWKEQLNFSFIIICKYPNPRLSTYSNETLRTAWYNENIRYSWQSGELLRQPSIQANLLRWWIQWIEWGLMKQVVDRSSNFVTHIPAQKKMEYIKIGFSRIGFTTRKKE